MATNEGRSVKEGEFTEFASAGEGTLGFDDNTLQAIAEVYKNEGNDAFKREEFSNAVAFYSEGIEVNCTDDELNAKLYHNRSMAHFYSGNYQESLDDAKAATELQPTYIKAIARGASACVKLLLYKEAITWCDKGLAVSTVGRHSLGIFKSDLQLNYCTFQKFTNSKMQSPTYKFVSLYRQSNDQRLLPTSDYVV